MTDLLKLLGSGDPNGYENRPFINGPTNRRVWPKLSVETTEMKLLMNGTQGTVSRCESSIDDEIMCCNETRVIAGKKQCSMCNIIHSSSPPKNQISPFLDNLADLFDTNLRVPKSFPVAARQHL
ncbi:hypothetical protein CKAN_01342400 [Cinnamomum micranthum f. kanehirae]|uniref:Uncharacterized protein n=1 Tax=Cinnamomum micranthum f. kanehirae TaxID=337451 RepID=A0A443P1E6_9MAGN|nr:hypothetical protein CKAN_01342400 [Cinnamomum micranthum f. kanehirae]